MGIFGSLILPLILHLLICLNGIAESFAVVMPASQDLYYPRMTAAQQSERELGFTESARGSRAYSARAEQIRHNRVMDRQMRQMRSRTRRSWR
jgi:hypothetical protein